MERDALAAQVQHLEEQLQKLTDKRVDLERTKVKLEGQLAEALQDVRQARKEKSDLENRVCCDAPFTQGQRYVLLPTAACRHVQRRIIFFGFFIGDVFSICCSARMQTVWAGNVPSSVLFTPSVLRRVCS